MGDRRDADDRRRVLEKVQRLALRGRVEKAIALLEQSLASAPPDDRLLLRLAELRRQQGDDAGAAAAFGEAARLFERQGFGLKVTAVLRQAVTLAPNDASLLASLADANVRLGLLRDAASYLERVAEILTSQNDRERALESRRRILDLLPGDLGATVRLADLLVEMDRADEALGLLRRVAMSVEASSDAWLVVHERVADLDPRDHGLALEIARTLLSRGSPKRALVRLKTTLEAHGDDPDTLLLVAQAFEAMGLSTKAAAAWREIAHLRQRAGEGPAAVHAWERVRELLPSDPEAAVALAPREGATIEAEIAEASFLAEQGLRAEALAILLRLREEFPQHPVVADHLALHRSNAGADETPEIVQLVDVDEASSALERPREGTTVVLARARDVARLDPAEASAHRDLAVAFLEMERFEEAIAEVERALATDPGREAEWCALLGRCHLERGAARDAIDAYRRSLAATGLSFEGAAAVHYELGRALESTGDAAAALTHYLEATRMEPGHRDVAGRIAALEATGRSGDRRGPEVEP